MSKSTNLPVTSGNQPPIVVSGPVSFPVIDNALSALQSALSVGIEIAKTREDGATQRALIAKQAEIEIARLESQRLNESDRMKYVHERRMKLISTISDLLVSNAQSLTPEIMKASEMLLQALQGEQ